MAEPALKSETTDHGESCTTVLKDDTLYTISLRCDVRVQQLCRFNGLRRDTVLRVHAPKPSPACNTALQEGDVLLIEEPSAATLQASLA